nr:ABC transporter permease [Segnochrobactrum spirostomi]
MSTMTRPVTGVASATASAGKGSRRRFGLGRLALACAALLALISLVLPAGIGRGPLAVAFWPSVVVFAAAVVLGRLALRGRRSPGLVGAGLIAALALAATNLWILKAAALEGIAGPGFWALVLAAWLGASAMVADLTHVALRSAVARRAAALAVPLLFGLYLFFLWEVIVRGFGVPSVLMPAPSAIALRFGGALPTLWQDFVQTFVRGVLSGYIIGNGAGFLVAIVADRVPFLRRGLLPLGNFVAALPIIGIAPIMVMWFGFDWPSKAAVVVVVTFFPMLVNTVAGLAAAGPLERDLMRSYAASYGQTLLKLRLPAALPFIFNALKINSTLALIGAIVAEFFGTPIVGMGFRISVEAGRMALDMVWAEIALAAIAGTAFYGILALIERAATFWHPSFRS